jgi:hypothetical protein
MVVAGMILLATDITAGTGGRRSPLDLGQDADLVVVGSASAGSQAGSVISFALQVARVVKGDATLTGGRLSVDWDLGTGIPRTMTAAAAVGGNGLWFLRRSGGKWELLPAMEGDVAFADAFFAAPLEPLSSAYSYSTSATIVDSVASETAFAIENAPPDSFRLQYLHMGPLDRFNSPVIQLLYQRLASSTATDKRILGLAGQIRGGSAAALSMASQGASSFAGLALENGVLLQSVQAWFRAVDPASVGVLGHVAVDAENGNLPFRRAAAFALAAIHTKEALPYLATLMTDADPELRAESVRGLGSFANGLPVQTMAGVPSLAHLQPQPNSPYRTEDTITHHPLNIQFIEENESTYLTFWKAWWQTNRAALEN